VEDDAQFSAALRMRLQTHGIAVVRAFDGADGIKCAFRYPADAVLLDYEMPRGTENLVLRKLKENPLTKDIPIIVLTGRKDQRLKQQMLTAGAAAYLTKPVDFDELLDQLARHIDVVSEPSSQA